LNIYFFIIQNFEQLALALINRVFPEIFHCLQIFFTLQDFVATCTCPETEFALKIFTVLSIVFTFRILEQLELALKNSVP